jgi:thiopurine S-methyltransferase
MEYSQGEMDGPPFSVSNDEVSLLFTERFSIQRLHTLDILQETERYQDKGVSQMLEHVYLLK